MATANSAVAAAIAACAFIAFAPAVPAQEQSPAVIMARTVCFDEIRAFEDAFLKMGGDPADAAARIDELLKLNTPAGDDRTYVLRDARLQISTAPGPSQRARAMVRVCAATVGAAADAGTRDLQAFKNEWADRRAEVLRPEGEADPSPSAPKPPVPSTLLTRNTRRVCANEIKAYEDDLLMSGESASAAASLVDDIIVTFTGDAEPREAILNRFDEMASQPGGSALERKKLAASACIATMGTLWSVGMRNFAEFNTHWTGKGRARFALAGHPVQPDPFHCIWVDWEVDGFGSPGTLRNSCAFTVDMRFCMAQVKAGSASESVACEKGLSRFERIEPKQGVRTTLTEGAIIRWTACKAPMQPVATTPPGGSFTATCK